MNAAQFTGSRSVLYPTRAIFSTSAFVIQLDRYAFIIFTVFKFPYFFASFATNSPSLDHEKPSSSAELKNGGNTLPCARPSGESTNVLSPFAKNQSSRCNHPFNATPALSGTRVNASRSTGVNPSAALSRARASPVAVPRARAPSTATIAPSATHAARPRRRASLPAPSLARVVFPPRASSPASRAPSSASISPRARSTSYASSRARARSRVARDDDGRSPSRPSSAARSLMAAVARGRGVMTRQFQSWVLNDKRSVWIQLIKIKTHARSTEDARR